jgi:hypothetical protein
MGSVSIRRDTEGTMATVVARRRGSVNLHITHATAKVPTAEKKKELSGWVLIGELCRRYSDMQRVRLTSGVLFDIIGERGAARDALVDAAHLLNRPH